MKILIIEDNKKLVHLMKEELQKFKFQVDISYTGNDGEEKIFINDYDTILLDLNLPDKDGLDILKYIRKSKINTPIIIISARDELDQRTLGLDLGADDYLIKPFEFSELRARIQASIRRYHGRSNPIIEIGKLSINPINRTAMYNDKVIPLLNKEFDILEYLAQRYPRVVSAEELIEHVYDESFDVFSSVIRVHIARTRKKMIECGCKEGISNIRGKGYVLCEE